jgi:hypothetical protein
MKLLLQVLALCIFTAPLTAGTGPTSPCPPPDLLGSWSTGDQVVWLSEEQAKIGLDGKLSAVMSVQGCEDGTVVLCQGGVVRELHYRRAEDGWEVELPRLSMNHEASWMDIRKLDEAPAYLDLLPLEIPAPRPLSPERSEEIRAELLRRREIDQKVRQGSVEDMDWEEMARVDRENTAWLRELIAEVGWIDRERFGDEGAKTAWLLVQHSEDLPLMMGSLPLIREHGDPSDYAYLHDRLALRLGNPQRYGSQFQYREDGNLAMSPLEDPETVDARRAEVGLPSLEESLEHWKDRAGPDGKIPTLSCGG